MQTRLEETHMTQPQTVPTDEQLELMTSLLEGADPDSYVVIPAGALVTQVQIALRETWNSRGEYQPGKASARLIRNLKQLGFTMTTRPGHEVKT